MLFHSKHNILLLCPCSPPPSTEMYDIRNAINSEGVTIFGKLMGEFSLIIITSKGI